MAAGKRAPPHAQQDVKVVVRLAMVAWLVACLVVRVVLDADAAVAALVVAAWVVVALRCQDLSVLSFFFWCLQHANMKLCARSAMNPMAALLQQQQLAASLLCFAVFCCCQL